MLYIDVKHIRRKLRRFAPDRGSATGDHGPPDTDTATHTDDAGDTAAAGDETESTYWRSSNRFVRAVDQAAEIMAAITMAVIVVVMFWNALSRKLLHSPIGWAEEVVTGLLLWLIAFGLYCASRRRELIVIRVILGRFSERTQLRLKFVTDILSAIILAHLAWIGTQYVLTFGSDASAYLRIPKGAFTVAIPIAAAMVALTTVLQIRSNRQTIDHWREEEQSEGAAAEVGHEIDELTSDPAGDRS